MQQGGVSPLPQTGSSIICPGPQTHDGLLFEEQDPEESDKSLRLIKQHIADMSALDCSGYDLPPPEYLAKNWHENMLWYGPAGIGTTYTIPRYQEQHQYPFRTGLTGKRFNGHICRFAEGNYAGFFGWPNLTNTPTGGFLGLPASDRSADMRVVDIYRREGDKIAETGYSLICPGGFINRVSMSWKERRVFSRELVNDVQRKQLNRSLVEFWQSLHVFLWMRQWANYFGSEVYFKQWRAETFGILSLLGDLTLDRLLVDTLSTSLFLSVSYLCK